MSKKLLVIFCSVVCFNVALHADANDKAGAMVVVPTKGAEAEQRATTQENLRKLVDFYKKLHGKSKVFLGDYLKNNPSFDLGSRDNRFALFTYMSNRVDGYVQANATKIFESLPSYIVKVINDAIDLQRKDTLDRVVYQGNINDVHAAVDRYFAGLVHIVERVSSVYEAVSTVEDFYVEVKKSLNDVFKEIKVVLNDAKKTLASGLKELAKHVDNINLQ